MASCYVYAIRDRDVVVYVGKGSGHRLATQQRRFGFPGDVLEECDGDTAAFKAERKWIAELQPQMNRCAGGNGNRRRTRAAGRKSAFDRIIDEVGTRRYAAMLLLGCERSQRGIVDRSKLDEIREVARGRWS
jgi:hypothetical protein